MMNVHTHTFEDDIAGVLEVRVSSDLAKYRCEYRGYLESRCTQNWQFVVFVDDEGNRHTELRFSDVGEDQHLALYRMRIRDIQATVEAMLGTTNRTPFQYNLLSGLGPIEALQCAGISDEMLLATSKTSLAEYEYVYYCLEVAEDNSLPTEPDCVLMDDDEEEWLVLMHKLGEVEVPELPDEYRRDVLADHIWQIREAMKP